MFRRHFLRAAIAACTVWISACSQAIPTQISVSQAQLEQGLSAQFPQQFPVAGLLQLQVQMQQLHMLPTSNQLQISLQILLNGPVLRQPLQGHMQVRFGLYYEPRDRSVRAERVEVLELDLSGADPALADMVKTYDLRVAQHALEGFALYTIPAEDLKQAHKLGLRPGAITVTAQGVDVALESTTSTSTAP